mgnify:CR=1 FL=1
MTLKEWKKVVATPVAELLKKHEFRKNGPRFAADRGDAKLLVEFQSSQMSDKNRLIITVNLKIFLVQLDRDPDFFPGNGHWQKRIGSFLTPATDYWWTCQNDEDATRAGKAIATILEMSALPEMEHLASARAMVNLWMSGRSPGLTQMQRDKYLAKLTGQPT